MTAQHRARAAIRASIRIHKAPVARIRKRIAVPDLPKLIRRMVEAQGRICPLCDDWLEFDPAFPVTHPLRPTIDHVVPRSRGGANVGNRFVMHRECNLRRLTGCRLGAS